MWFCRAWKAASIYVVSFDVEIIEKKKFLLSKIPKTYKRLMSFQDKVDWKFFFVRSINTKQNTQKCAEFQALSS